MKIDHGKFNHTEFIDKKMTVLGKENDPRSATLSELDITRVQLVSVPQSNENKIFNGNERLNSLKRKNKFVFLDADIFFVLWKNQYLIPENWRTWNGRPCRIFFEGTIFVSKLGFHYVLYLFWDISRWKWDIHPLEELWFESYLSAVLIPSPEEYIRLYSIVEIERVKFDKNKLDKNKLYNGKRLDDLVNNSKQQQQFKKITFVDISKIKLESFRKGKEKSITSLTRYNRFFYQRKKYLGMDFDVYLFFMNNQHLIPGGWKDYVGVGPKISIGQNMYMTSGMPPYVYFDGDTFFGSSDNGFLSLFGMGFSNFVLYLKWDDRRNEWYFGSEDLEYSSHTTELLNKYRYSAVIEKDDIKL